VKLIDVYSGDYPNPDPNPAGVQMGGYQQLVRGEAMRGKFRNSYSRPEPFEPGKVTKVEYLMPDIFHTFRRGHRIMVQVQSTWFPLIDRNPQKFCDIYHASDPDFQKATQRVYHSSQAHSELIVNVLPPAKP
jgi:predicted acyl esterase